MKSSAVVLLVLLCTLAAACTTGPTGGPRTRPVDSSDPSAAPRPITLSATDWPTYHHDNQRSGTGVATPSLGRLSRAWSARLDGAVYGQPLVLGGRVLAATEQDSVYALRAADGHVLWSRHLGTPQPKSGLPCGDIDPLGITGTAAYDARTGLVFVVAETVGGRHTLYGLNARTGSVVLRRSVEPPRGKAADHQQRAALTVSQGRVYIAYGGLFGDCGDYVGSVVSVPTSGTGPARSYAVPTAKLGGIWAPAGGVVVDGKLLYAVGNGASTDRYDHSDAVLALTPALRLADSFSPARWAKDNANDLDIGSTSPAVVHDYVYIDGKRGVGYVLDRRHLGGVGGAVSQTPVCRAFGGDAVAGSTVYVPCTRGISAVAVDQSGHASILWSSTAGSGSPVVGGGAVWTVDLDRGDLVALDQRSGAVRARQHIGRAPHFASPTLSGSRAYVGTLDGVVAIDGV
ncbi:MAG: PQQ-binding-like beta-propeller repeat protein [Sciscionella sp.]